MENEVLVTGATGNLGRAAVAALQAEGLPIRAAARQISKIAPVAGTNPVHLDYAAPASFVPALAGAAGVFLTAPPLDPDAPAKLIPFIAQAKAARVRRIVFVSALGADHDERSPLRQIEHAVTGSGLDWAILRPNFFMDNFTTGFLAPMIQAQQGIFLAAGEGRTSFIAAADIAAVAAQCFHGRFAGQALDLTGPEALDHARVATILSQRLNRVIAYHPLTEAAMLQGAREQGLPEGSVQVLAALYAAVRAGLAAMVTPTVAQATGRPPLAFADFVDKHAAVLN